MRSASSIAGGRSTKSIRNRPTRKDRREVLAESKADRNLRSIPVVIVTSSPAEEDILKSLHHARQLLRDEARERGRFMQVVKSIEESWLSVVKRSQGCAKS